MGVRRRTALLGARATPYADRPVRRLGIRLVLDRPASALIDLPARLGARPPAARAKSVTVGPPTSRRNRGTATCAAIPQRPRQAVPLAAGMQGQANGVLAGELHQPVRDLPGRFQPARGDTGPGPGASVEPGVLLRAAAGTGSSSLAQHAATAWNAPSSKAVQASAGDLR